MSLPERSPSPAPRGRPRRPSGQVAPIMAVVLVLAGLVGAGVVHVAAAASRRAAAQAAADGAALAGAAGGPDAARRVATRNRARIVSYQVIAFDVVVTVVRGDARATARARWAVATPPSDPAPPGAAERIPAPRRQRVAPDRHRAPGSDPVHCLTCP